MDKIRSRNNPPSFLVQAAHPAKIPAKLYDTLGIPLTKTMEKLLPPKIGKNILIIGQKPKK